MDIKNTWPTIWYLQSIVWVERLLWVITSVKKILENDDFLSDEIKEIQNTLNNILENGENQILCVEFDKILLELHEIRILKKLDKNKKEQKIVLNTINLINEIKNEYILSLEEKCKNKTTKNNKEKELDKYELKNKKIILELNDINTAGDLMDFYKKYNSQISYNKNKYLDIWLVNKFIELWEQINWSRININRIDKLKKRFNEKEEYYIKLDNLEKTFDQNEIVLTKKQEKVIPEINYTKVDIIDSDEVKLDDIKINEEDITLIEENTKYYSTDLIIKAQEWDDIVFKTLVDKNMWLVGYMMKKFSIYISSNKVSRDDMESAWLIWLVYSIRNFDFSKWVEFSTFAYLNILRELQWCVAWALWIKHHIFMNQRKIFAYMKKNNINKENINEVELKTMSSKLDISVKIIKTIFSWSWISYMNSLNDETEHWTEKIDFFNRWI